MRSFASATVARRLRRVHSRPPRWTVCRDPFVCFAVAYHFCKRHGTGLPWPKTAKNATLPVRLNQAVRKLKVADPPWPSSDENAILSQRLQKTQATGPPWQGSGVIDRVRAVLGEAVA
ncbi:hypothetical protein Y032_0637g944 [Ancylostoma ceylanicum]|uniref:Uncharacterized protein n=1 Tax=Ancylostoma ceylanicum TaxID=53326 RepID=A0A016WLG8_9BILA|nr:hypothetical protein Y032_0637g944 [Ancylostoma ceylanicum]